MRWILLLSISLLVVSCGEAESLQTITQPSKEDSSGGPTPAPSPAPPPPVTGDESIDSKLHICSKLDFKGMTAPKDLNDTEINGFALGLNISASFEGRQGWKNITNNFDGMGLSLGLLNQTLGTGSLQPLLVRMLEKHEAAMKAQYSQAHYTSIKAMALDWKLATGFVVQAMQEEDLFAPNGSVLSSLDEGEVFETFGAAENKSVSWAKANLYKDAAGKTFKADWKSELQAMAGTNEYRDLQFAAARSLHNKAAGYVVRFKLKEIRSYLFMFDIVVQNGGFYQKNFDDYKKFITANPNATEEQKLKSLLTSRLVQVRSQFRDDVKSRKEGLINGKGRVHQTDRNFEKEYCYKSLEVII